MTDEEITKAVIEEAEEEHPELGEVEIDGWTYQLHTPGYDELQREGYQIRGDFDGLLRNHAEIGPCPSTVLDHFRRLTP